MFSNGLHFNLIEKKNKTGKINVIVYSRRDFPSCCGAEFISIKSVSKRYMKQAVEELKTINVRSGVITDTANPTVAQALELAGFKKLHEAHGRMTYLRVVREPETYTSYIKSREDEEEEEW